MLGWVELFLLVATASSQARKEDDKEEKAKSLIVMITGQLAGQETIGAGIIFGVANDRLYIATANHVVRKGMQTVKNLRVFFKFLPGDSIEAKVTNSDPVLDLAVLMIEELQKQKIPVDKLEWNVLADPDTLHRNTLVHSAGYANGVRWATPVQDELIAKADKLELTFESNITHPGQSGGGLFNARWELVGMVKQLDPPYTVATNFNRILDKLIKDWGYSIKLTTPEQAAKITETPNTAPRRKKKWWQNPLVIGGGVVVVGAGIAAVLLWPPPSDEFPPPPGRPSK